MNRVKNKKGFTLIELLVVSTIIVVLSAIGLVSFVNAGKSARDGKRKADLETVRQALVLYRSDVGEYPNGVTGADYDGMIPTLSSGYLSNPTPVDPKNDLVYFYTYTPGAAGATFALSATLEKDPSIPWVVTNP